MVERVPRDPRGGIAHGPLAPGQRRPVRRLAQDVEQGAAHEVDAGGVGRIGRRELDPHLAGIGSFGVQDVADDLVAVSASTSRALPELGRSVRDDAIERRPRGVHETDQAVRVVAVGRSCVELRHRGRNAEVRPAAARNLLDDVVLVGLEDFAGSGRDDRIAWRRRPQRVEREFRRLSGPGPAGPVDRAGERLLQGLLDRHRDLHDAPRAVASRSSPTSLVSLAISRPSDPSASTRADATITPSAPAVAIDRTCSGVLTPNPTATGTGDAALTSRTSRATEAGSAVRAPVTPTSETQYRKPPLRLATAARRFDDVVGATR